MKKTFLLPFLLFVLSSQIIVAQKISVRGQLVDSAGVALPSATILILSAGDSSLVNFGVSGSDGRFEIKNLSRQNYLFKATFVGYAPIMKQIAPTYEPVVDLGVLKMSPQSKLLDEVSIESRAPVVVKKDTIEFNAESFKSIKQNAVVEDLLKRLPGVEVDADGTIRAQGEQVKRVTVDGKNFFGNDPKLATRNLPADAIDKVQVFDKKSDQTIFSGIDDGQREKTINLELKEEKRNGVFGNLLAGAGTDSRYQGKANINRFKKGQQFSFLGMANNTNDQGFSIDDYLSFTGASQQMMGGSGGSTRVESNSSSVPLNTGGRNKGLMDSYAGGLNFNNEFNKKTELNASYFYNYLDHDVTTTTDRINYFSTGDLTFNQNSRQHNTNANHRINTVLDHKIDSLNSVKLTTSFSYNETDAFENSTSQNYGVDGSIENESERITSSDGATATLNTTLLWRHRFAKKGRTLSTNLTFGITDSNRDGQQDATNTYYEEDTTIEYVLQTNDQTTENLSYSAGFSYTEPLGNRKYLEASYSFRQNLNDVDRRVYDLNSGESIFNSELSNQYQSDYQYHRAGLNFRMNKSKYNVTVGTSLQQTSLNGELILSNSTIEKSYQNILPVVRFNFDFSSNRHLRLDYETSVQEPTIQQLQPVVDNSDPLNLTVGNPDLRPAYAQSWRLHFITFNPANFISLFAFANATYTTNYIATSQTYTEQQVRTSKPVNVDNNLSLSGNATFSFPVQKLFSRLGITASATHENGVNVLNDLESNIAQNTIGGTLRYNFRYKEVFDINLSANISRESTEYESNSEDDQLFFNKKYMAEMNLSFLKNYSLNTEFEYLIYESKTTDYKQDIPLLNISVSRSFLKAKSGELKFSVNNVLDQSIWVSQQADVNYFERQIANTLGRYYMLTFIYSINKQLNPMGMRPRGPMIRMIR